MNMKAPTYPPHDYVRPDPPPQPPGIKPSYGSIPEMKKQAEREIGELIKQKIRQIQEVSGLHVDSIAFHEIRTMEGIVGLSVSMKLD